MRIWLSGGKNFWSCTLWPLFAEAVSSILVAWHYRMEYTMAFPADAGKAIGVMCRAPEGARNQTYLP